MLQRLSRGLAPSFDSAAQLWSMPARLFDATFSSLLRWSERAHQRQQLAELSDYGLKDLGLTRSDVVRECSKRFWEK